MTICWRMQIIGLYAPRLSDKNNQHGAKPYPATCLF